MVPNRDSTLTTYRYLVGKNTQEVVRGEAIEGLIRLWGLVDTVRVHTTPGSIPVRFGLVCCCAFFVAMDDPVDGIYIRMWMGLGWPVDPRRLLRRADFISAPCTLWERAGHQIGSGPG